jgi:hypothetical protein
MRRFKGDVGPEGRRPEIPAPRISTRRVTPAPTMSEELPSAEELLALSPAGADDLLQRLEAGVPVRPGFVDLPTRGFREAIVFGDTHGDWRTSLEVEHRFLEESGGPRCVVGLGDYVDRPPPDCPGGSVVNAVRWLALTARFPDRVFLLQGNHETVDRILARPHSLDRELDELWGPSPERYRRLVALLERGPLAAGTSTGVYLAHAGFPRGGLSATWRRGFEDVDEARLIDLVWSDPEASRRPHGADRPWDGTELRTFLDLTGFTVFLRGHDPDLMGRPLYDGRCLTLHTTRVYERYGGIIVARVPLDRPVRTVLDLAVEHLPTEGRKFPPAA